VERWTLIEPEATLANDFYGSREQAEAALAEARRLVWHPADAAALAPLHVERNTLDPLEPTLN
jgi:hypothetical protein